jgi:hypothetical protein
MSVTLIYDTTLSRVQIAATGLGDAVTAVVERSTNQITWTTVRGGVDVPVTAGVMATVDDYEFAPDTLNYYRATYTAAMSFVAAGTVAHGNNASVVPGLPAGLAAGDAMFLLAAIRNSGTGVPNTPAGWTKLADAGNMCLFGKPAGASESAPTVSFAGGVANADTSAQIAAFRGVDMTPFGVPTVQLNGSAQDIVAPAITLPSNLAGGLNLWAGWKQDDWTSVAVVSGGTEIDEPDTITGDDQGIVWDYRILAHATVFSNLTARTFAVTGGASAISRAATLVFQHALTNQSNSITPALGGVWLKNLSRPFLNRPVTVTEFSDIERPARNGIFPIIGRTYPIARTDLRLGRAWTVEIKAETVAESDELDLCLAAGDPVLVHVPADSDVPGGYVVIGDVTIGKKSRTSGRRYLTLPMTEVAAPGPDVVGATNTWASVIATYATWADEIADNSTWQDVVNGIAAPGDVIVS